MESCFGQMEDIDMRIGRKHIRMLIKLMAGLMWIPLLIIMTGRVSIKWHGFGVDSEGTIYVGMEKEIATYEEGNYVGSISIPRFRSYRMKLENDTIVIATSSYICTYDTNGTQLSREEDPHGSVHDDMKSNMTSCQTKDGRQYNATTLLRHRILRDDGVVVYKMHWWDYCVKVFFAITLFSFVLNVIILVLNGKIKSSIDFM